MTGGVILAAVAVGSALSWAVFLVTRLTERRGGDES